MANGTDAKLVLSEYSWVQRNLVPISESVTSFEADCLKPAAAIESFQLCLSREPEAIGQTHLHFLGESVIGKAVTKSITFVDFSKIPCPRRQNVSGSGGRET